MAINLGSAYGKIVIDASGVKDGVNEATKSLGGLNAATTTVGKTMTTFGSRIRMVDTWLRNNTLAMAQFGMSVQEGGRKMMTFISLPILAFFGLLIKKALDADTAMGKLGKESITKLNTSLAKLGEKFLPLFIKIVDWLTLMIDKFLEADPATQKLITMLIIGFGLILPIMLQFAGWLISIVGFLGSLGITASTAAAFITGTLIPALGLIGGTIATVILPILLIIATLGFLYWAFKTNFMGITDTVKQLWFIIKFYFSEGWKWLVNAVKGGGTMVMDWFKRMIDRIVAAFKNINWAQIGRNMILGIINGLLGGLPALVAAAARVAQSALNAIKSKLGIRSPSAEFMKLGAFSGQGFQQGLAQTMDPNLIARAMARPVQNMTSQQNTRNTIHMANGLTLRDLDDMMNRKIDKFTMQLNNALGGG